MSELFKVASLHMSIFVAQTICMYVSSKAETTNRRKLFLIGLLIALAMPIIAYHQNQRSILFYEYAIVFCVFYGFLADVVYVASTNKDYMSGDACYRLTYSYLFICVMTAFIGLSSTWVKVLTAILMIVLIALPLIKRKHTLKTVIRAIPLAAFSIISSGLFHLL